MLGVHGVGGSNPPSPISKPRLRALARQQASRRPVEFRDNASAAIVESLLSCRLWREAELMLCYHALPSEVQTAGILAAARAGGRAIGVPRVDGTEIVFHALPADELGYTRSSLGVLEPPADSARLEPEPGLRLLVVVPGLLFDAEGYRLGRGGGHYDRFVARARARGGATFVGLCFDDQLVERLPRDPWDQPVDALVTETRGLIAVDSHPAP
jgi:5-formyltetrahydrofolate cyclo-ligase